MRYYVYMMTNKLYGVIYIGITNNLIRRVFEHKNHLVKSFTCRYNLEMLVWFEQTEDINSAIAREKQLKNWHRQWKIELIQVQNPNWQDLYESILGWDAESSSAWQTRMLRNYNIHLKLSQKATNSLLLKATFWHTC